jgi:hypothetical protein
VRGASGGSGLIRFPTYHLPLSSPRFSHCPQHLLKTALGRNTSFCGPQTKKKEGKKKNTTIRMIMVGREEENETPTKKKD